jgi:glucan phosphoethanolaminetransferase (alkaline phosphatase superfamily)
VGKKDRVSINYIYFGIFFGLLVLTSLSCILAKENLSGSRFFFSLYAVGQALLETSFLVFAAWAIRRFLKPIYFSIFIAATFFLGILHLFDLFMERILDLSVWETLDFVFDESLSNFLLLLDASGVPLWGWGLFFGCFLLLPFLGIWLYRISESFSSRVPCLVRREVFLQLFVCIPVALFLWDLTGSGVLHPDSYTAFIKSLPWKTTFLPPSTLNIALQTPLAGPPLESNVIAAIDAHPIQTTERPNVYLFVIESFRSDCITNEITPHLFGFKQTTTCFDQTVSNANASQVAWYSLFHSELPLRWREMQLRGWDSGSPGLNFLKKAGYQIRAYCSAQLHYYGMEELLFGKEHHLLTSYEHFHHKAPVETHQADLQALEALEEDMNNPELQQGQVFIVFWDSTHFDYSWPKDVPARFTPFAKEFAYFKAFQSQASIELIKNRYRNAVHYIDSLFGRFLEKLPHPDKALVVVTGDHGEEFFEHGHLFHGSRLTSKQINIPLYMRFGLDRERPILHKRLISQMDVFPSLIDYITGAPPAFLQGESVFQERKHPFVLSARMNASRTPYEFCIQNGRVKLIARFGSRSDVFHSKNLRVLSLLNSNDQSLPDSKRHINQWVEEEFGSAFDTLFNVPAQN